jgi:CubicO group peptidase (beta-lactamase class C family)
MTFCRAHLCQWTAIWFTTACLGLISAPGAAQEKESAKAAFPVATPESQGVSTAAVRRLADEVQEYVKNGTIVGGELLVIKNRKTILHEAFGDRDRDEKRAMERNTIFNIRSMTKPLTGVAIQMLADEGKLRLDDPVAKYVSGFDNEKSKAITIQQLLEHKSGLPLTILSLRLDQYPDLQAQANATGEKGPQFKPGEKFWYSDAGSDAAAAVVEKISGMTIDRFVAARILEPLGMSDSFYVSKADDPRKSRIASPYLGAAGIWIRFWKPDGPPLYPFAWGSQTLYSTPVDYARFLELWMDGGMVGDQRLLSKEAIARILTPTSAMKSMGTDKPYPSGFFGLKAHYGQMSLLHAPGENPTQSDVKAFGHSGSDGTAAWAFPTENLIVCYFTQSRGQASPIRLETTIQDALLQPEVTGKVPEEMKPLLGTYYATFGSFNKTPFQILFRCGKLALDVPTELVNELDGPDKEGRWKIVNSKSNAVSFKKDGEGNITAMLMHRGNNTHELPRAKPADAETPKN